MNIKYFTAPWCVPCRTFGPIMESVAAQYPEFGFEKINADDSPDLIRKYEVMSIPTVIIERDGVEQDRFSGARPQYFVEGVLGSLR